MCEIVPQGYQSRWVGLLGVVIISFVLSGAGCSAAKGNIEIGPFYYNREVPVTGGREGALLWPFFQWESTDSVRQYGFRPLFNIRWENEAGTDAKTEVQALWPLFLYRDRPQEFRIRVFTVFHYTDYQRPEGTRDISWALFPLLFGGRSHDRGPYFAFFPLGGVIHRILGKDRIRFLLFPLYADVLDGEHRSWNILWPIFQHGKGEGRISYRIWPLLGRKSKEGVYRKEFLLWPIFIHLLERQGLEHPTESWFFIPFYGRQQTSFGYIYYWLFPLFSYQRSEATGDRIRELNAPWPLFTLARGDNYRKTYFWPVWGKKISGEFETRFTLYPLFWSYVQRTKEATITRRWYLPFYWSWNRSVQGKERGSARMVKIWPFMDYERCEEMRRVQLLSPLWFRDPDGFERNYSVFWQWYSRTEQQGEWVSSRILWFRTYRGLDDSRDKTREMGAAPGADGMGDEVRGSETSQGESGDGARGDSFEEGEVGSIGGSLLKDVANW